MGTVLSVNMSVEKGTSKKSVDTAKLIKEHGIDGDAHAGRWHRQISLLANESVNKMRLECDIELPFGIFGENIDSEGLDLSRIAIGQRLRAGECVLEITQIGKECHSDCDIRKQVGKCVMPTEGVFARVMIGGTLKAGDIIELA